MGKVVYLKQKNWSLMHTKEGCPGMFELKRKDDIPYLISSKVQIHLDNTPFVLCETCQTAYFPSGFEEWLERSIVFNLFNMGTCLPGFVYQTARRLADYSSEDLAKELGMNPVRYKEFETSKINIHDMEELKIKLCLSRLLNFDVYSFKGITQCEDFWEISGLERLDVSNFEVSGWF